MAQLDKVLIGLLLGCAFPVFFSMIALVDWFYFNRNDEFVSIYVASGLLLGLFTDIRFLKGWITRRYKLPIWLIAGIYLLYNIVNLGSFMGFPVFNIFWGVVAGYYFGLRVHYQDIPPADHPRIIRQVSIFTTLVMTMICIISGWIALAGTGVGKDLESMFGLDFEITKTMIFAVVVIGGVTLIAFEYAVTKITMTTTIRYYL